MFCFTEPPLVQCFLIALRDMKNAFKNFNVVSESGVLQNPLLEHHTYAFMSLL